MCCVVVEEAMHMSVAGHMGMLAGGAQYVKIIFTLEQEATPKVQGKIGV